MANYESIDRLKGLLGVFTGAMTESLLRLLAAVAPFPVEERNSFVDNVNGQGGRDRSLSRFQKPRRECDIQVKISRQPGHGHAAGVVLPTWIAILLGTSG